MNNSKMVSNLPRKVAADAFREVLKRFQGKGEVSEQNLAQAWSEGMSVSDHLSVNGWYDPPPGGIAVLTGLDRISFNSLRDRSNWPSDHTVDWSTGALYAYCSPASVVNGMPGDFAITLYFGSDQAIRSHFLIAHEATREVLKVARGESSSRALFRRSNEIFESVGLRNCVISYTDTTPLDLGHTYPVLDDFVLDGNRKLTPEACDGIRQARRFLNNDSDWDLRSCGQFTIEPQLVSEENPELPQVTFHYVIDPSTGMVLDEPDAILEDFGLRS
ncbi:hypothetical protein [Streptomyces antimycoticus]